MLHRITDSVTATLRDGRTVEIRSLHEEDANAMLAFGTSLPANDHLYLEDDLQSPDMIARLVYAYAAENWRQVVAVSELSEIVAYAAVRKLPGWSNHVGDVRLIVSDGWRGSGLGTTLGQAIFELARSLGVSKVIVEMLDAQYSGRTIFERLGFQIEGTFADHARDRNGQHHKLLVLAYHVA